MPTPTSEGGTLPAGAGQSQDASLKAVPLLQPTLALLDKFGPYFSIEYHGELLAALEGLLNAPKLPLALRLSCLCSSSAMTSCAPPTL